MVKRGANRGQANVPPVPPGMDKGDGGSHSQLRGLDSNPQGAFGPRFWQAVCGTLTPLYTGALAGPPGSGAARLIGAAMQEFYALAEDLTVSEAEAAIEGIVTLTTACARARLAGDEAGRVKSRRKAALDYIDARLGNAQLGPDEIAD